MKTIRLLVLSAICAIGIVLGVLGHGGCAPTTTAPIVRLTNWTPKELLLVESKVQRGAPPVYRVINEFPFA